MKPYHDKTVLEKHYIEDGQTCKEIGSLYGVSPSVIWDCLKKFDIPTRPNHVRPNLPPTKRQKQGWQSAANKLKGRVFSAETLKKMSLAASGRNNKNYGKRRPIHGKRVWYTCPNGEIVSMRSNWEACYADWLNEKHISWEYEPQTFILGDGSAYTPDFFLPDLNQYVEVKGWLHAKHKEKIVNFRQSYPNLNLIVADKAYLKEIGCDLTKEHPSNRPNLDKECPICKKRFKPKVKQQVYCSIQCRNKHVSATPKQTKSEKPKRSGKYNQAGHNNNSAKLTENKVLEIIALRKQGATLKEIASKTNATVGNVCNILKGRSWRHLTHQEGF